MSDKSRAERYVDELYQVAVNVRTGQTRKEARREFWLDWVENIIRETRAELLAPSDRAAAEELAKSLEPYIDGETRRGDLIFGPRLEERIDKITIALTAARLAEREPLVAAAREAIDLLRAASRRLKGAIGLRCARLSNALAALVEEER